MREAKEVISKAKKIDEDQWIKGHFMEFNDRCYFCMWTYGPDFPELGKDDFIEVDPKTILSKVLDFEDSEGQDCFEGDICNTSFHGNVVSGYILYCDLELKWFLQVKDRKYALRDISIYNTGKNIHYK